MTSGLDTHPDLAARAFHESGHAVAVVRNGLDLRSVDIADTSDRLGATNYKSEQAPCEVQALVLLAGGAAERRHTKQLRAHDDGDLAALRVLFHGSAVDPDRPYAEQLPGADAERQRIVDDWYGKAETLVEREWPLIERVAQALQRRERLTGDEVKQLCASPVVHVDRHPVVHVDPPLPTPTVVPDPALVTKIADSGHNGNVIYNTKQFELAHERFLDDAKSLTDTDLAQLAVVDSQLAERARAKRAGFVEVHTEAEKKFGARQVRAKDLLDWFNNYLGPILATHRYKSRDAHTRLDALEQQVLVLKKELDDRPCVKYCGVWRDDAVYGVGNLVTLAGSLWHAIDSTNSRPGTEGCGWQLIVKQGRA